MSLDSTVRGRSPSLPGSGRSTPVPRASRRAVEDGILKADKNLRKYAATIERALNSWEISPQEWADYIAFLGRLLKAIQSRPNNATLLPYSGDVASKLAQCLNPALPSGVHQKALEVYHHVFATFGQGYLAGHLHEFLPGLASVLSFASLSVRPGLYEIYEEFIVHLPKTNLRPVLKSLILSLLPALEDETGEDFERAFRIVESLERVFSPADDDVGLKKDGYFWQCLFLAVITSPARRQGALNLLTRRLPKFTSSASGTHSSNGTVAEPYKPANSSAAEAVLSPEPGLLIRCFAAGLSDHQVLVQRGFLDLLVTHIPLESPVVQSTVRTEDVNRLITAAMRVLLRREMSLNRRLWSWFLGPDTSADANGSGLPPKGISDKQTPEAKADRRFQYFNRYGRSHLERCVLAMFNQSSADPTEAARPFRICLSLMDRWEIGGSVVPSIFLPAMHSVYSYSLQASTSNTTDVLRSASLFFDGVESMLIWSNLIKLPAGEDERNDRSESLRMLAWIVQHFNVNDEEMTTTHIPNTAILTLTILATTKLPELQTITMLDTLGLLFDLIPERLLSSSNQMSNAVSEDQTHASPAQLHQKIEHFYQGQQPSGGDPPFAAQSMAGILWRLVSMLAIGYLRAGRYDCFSKSTALLLGLGSKLSVPSEVHIAELLDNLASLMGSPRTDSTMAFSSVSSLVSLLSWLSSKVKPEDHTTRCSLATLQQILNAQLWIHLSPAVPKFNVEAAKAIWQLHDHSASPDTTERTLTALVRHVHETTELVNDEHVESIRRFIVLWNHTVASFASGKKTSSVAARRASTMSVVSDGRIVAERQEVLASPLSLVLDSLNGPTGPARDTVSTWIRNTSSLQHILTIQFDLLLTLAEVHTGGADTGHSSTTRMSRDKTRDLEYALDHLLGIIRCEDDRIWQALGEINLSPSKAGDTKPGLSRLAEHCIGFISNDSHGSRLLKRKSIDILLTILSSPSALALKPLDLDSKLLDHLMASLPMDHCELQGPLLKLINLALGVRLWIDGADHVSDSRPRSSLTLKRPSHAGMHFSPNSSAGSLVTLPPPQLLDCLKLGFSSRSARAYLDQWLLFLSNILPFFADSIFANLLPLVECFCRELKKIQGDLISLSKVNGNSVSAAPESAAISLLDALEIILSQAHERLIADSNTEPEVKPVSQSRGLLGNVTVGVFKTESAPSRTAQANSRLIIVLALHDAVRVAVELWVWSSRYTEADGFDKTSSATTLYSALKLRTRSRHLLERIFTVEPLESLEIVISTWCYSTNSGHASATLDLLHVIQGLRPKNIVPATLDALCSRTNPTVLSGPRLSSQTVDLTAVDVAFFLQAYLKSVEDDAMDEIWSDCTAFLRDVLANPLPYRQVLPGLLSVVLLLVQKVDNTNFGEQRKMRRDLGDLFMRLLTATFTTTSSSLAEDETWSENAYNEDETNSTLGRRHLSLVSVMKAVTANIEVVLESQDRITTATSSITASIVSPLVHAKAFPGNMTANSLALLLQISKKSPQAKPWKKDLSEAFNDPRLLTSSIENMEHNWFPVLHQWIVHDKERMPELVSRLVAPSSAGIMFGVGASAARLEADRKAQLNLRRICVLLLASPKDTFVAQLRDMWEKLVELFDANLSSSPSTSVKAELFMLCRALTLCTSSIHLAPLWPVINDSLQAAFTSLTVGASTSGMFGNLALLQACKLLDLLVALSPDEFQLHEWLYISDTTDAVYQPSDWTPSALSDQIAEHLAADGIEDSTDVLAPSPLASATSGRRRPLIHNELSIDKGDYKAMTREDFAKIVLRPFLSQLSIYAYEGVYSMEGPDSGIWRRILLEDILDLTTIVE